MKLLVGVSRVLFLSGIVLGIGFATAEIPENVLDAIELWEDLDFPADPNCLLVNYVSLSKANSEEARQLELYLREFYAVAPVATRSELLDICGFRKFDCSNLSESQRRMLVRQLREFPIVQSVEENNCINLADTPSDPRLRDLWGLKAIKAKEAWEIETDSRNVIVAVVDSGIDYLHEDLSANMWKNPGEVPGNGIDDDRNGFVDDVYGYDFGDNDADIMDRHGHGTHVAGILGARGNNGIGTAGVSWRADIMGVKVMDTNGRIYYDALVEGIAYAVEMGASVINLSLGGSWYNASLKNAISMAESQGVVVVVAAGNSGLNTDVHPFYPSCYLNSNILSVAATDSRNRKAYFSNYGPVSVDVAAPGVSILSTLPNGKYGYMSGTSMATPHVTGAVALAMSVFGESGDDKLRCDQVRDDVLETVQVTGALGGTNSFGRVIDLAGLLKRSSRRGTQLFDSFSSSRYVTACEIEIPFDGAWKIEYNVVSSPNGGGNAQAKFFVGNECIEMVERQQLTPSYVHPSVCLLYGRKSCVVELKAGETCRIAVRSLGGENRLDLARIDITQQDPISSVSEVVEDGEYLCEEYTYWDDPPWYWFPSVDGPWHNVLYVSHCSPEPGDWEFLVDLEVASCAGKELEVLLVDGERDAWERVDFERNVSGRLVLHRRIVSRTVDQTAYLRVVIRCEDEIEVDQLKVRLRKCDPTLAES